MFILLLALLQSQEIADPPLLKVGQTIEASIEDSDPRIETPTLKANYTEAPVVGKSYRLEVEEAGPYTIELRSYLFDAYLVLRSAAGEILAEDDDGAVGIHARITVELDPVSVYQVEACALHGGRGVSELEVQKGQSHTLSPQEERAAERSDFERTVAIREKVLGPENLATATSLDNLARLLKDQGDDAAERSAYERALAIREKVLGPDHPDTATTLHNLGAMLWAKGDYAAARPYYERVLAIDERVLGPDDPGTATDLYNLARVLQDQGDYSAARPCFERALAIQERVLGPEHRDTSSSIEGLATLLKGQGDYAAARPLMERALAIDEKVLGPEHPGTAGTLNNLARLLYAQGDFSAARPLYERALAIKEKVLGPEHSDTAAGLNNLARLLTDQGDYAAARPLAERALTICEKVHGPEHPNTAACLASLATLLQAQGDYAAARPYFERALAIKEKMLGPEHPETARSLNNLALLLKKQGDCTTARSYYERALAISEKALGPEHPDTATSLNNLARLLQEQGDYATARPLLERALAIREKALGPEHPRTATCLCNLARLFEDQGDYAAARPLYERALAIDEKTLGAEHPDTAWSRYNLATLVADGGFESQSFDLARQAMTACLAQSGRFLWALSEKERMLSLVAGEKYLRLVLSLATKLEPAGQRAEDYELALAWRGLSSRTLLESHARLQAETPEEARADIENLQGVQRQLSKLLYATETPDRDRHEREIRALRDRRNELEVGLLRLIGPGSEKAVTLAVLRKSLEPGCAFLDFLVHPLYEPAERDGEKVVRKGEWSAEHLSAWVVRPDRELVQLDLGLAAPIEAEVKRWLGEIASSRGIAAEENGEESGKKLRELLWAPLAAALDGVTRVFVRPDSFLGTLPFEVIPLVGGRYLVEEKGFVYVQTPLDLVRRKGPASERSASLLAVGGVDFKNRAALEESSATAAPIVASAARGDELRGSLNQFWSKLPHTENEAQTVSDLFEASDPKSERLLLFSDSPTEERLKRELPRHAFVHLATHGFFHPAGTVSLWDSAREAAEEDELRGLEQETRGLVGELPGLLSGLVCAGANEVAPAGRDDGLLTAEEVLWLDLSHVELVVLSACETALGERRSGEGMIGLRRAFGLAGAKTVVSSLWSVKDRSTSELMQRFYENLLVRHQGRAEALRNAQLALLAQNRATEHDALPSTWGAFVLSGEWR